MNAEFQMLTKIQKKAKYGIQRYYSYNFNINDVILRNYAVYIFDFNFMLYTFTSICLSDSISVYCSIIYRCYRCRLKYWVYPDFQDLPV